VYGDGLQVEDGAEASSTEGEIGEGVLPRGDTEGFRDGDSRRPRRNNRPQPRRFTSEGPVSEVAERPNGFIPRNGRVYPDQPKAVPLQRPERENARAPPVTRSEGPGPGPVGGPQGSRPPRTAGDQLGRDPPLPKAGPPGLRAYASSDRLPTAQQLEREGETRERPRSATVKPRAPDTIMGERPGSATNLPRQRGVTPASDTRLGQPGVQPAPSGGAQAAPGPVAEAAEVHQPVPVAPVSAPGSMPLQFGELPPAALAPPPGPASPRATALGSSSGPLRPLSPLTRKTSNDAAGESNVPVFGTYAEGAPLAPAEVQMPAPGQGGFEPSSRQELPARGPGPSTSVFHPSAALLQPPPPDPQGPGSQPLPSGGRQQSSVRNPLPVGPPVPGPSSSILRNEASAHPPGPGPEKQSTPHKQMGNTGHVAPDMVGQGSGSLRARPQARRPQEGFANQGHTHGQPMPYHPPNNMPPRLANGTVHGSGHPPLANGLPTPPHMMGLPPASPQASTVPPPLGHIARAKHGLDVVKGRGASAGPMPGASGGMPHQVGQMNSLPQPPPNGLRGVPPATAAQSPVRPNNGPLPHGALPMSPTSGRFPSSPAGASQLGPSVRGQQQHPGRGVSLHPPPGPMMGPPGQHGGPMGGPGNLQHIPGSQVRACCSACPTRRPKCRKKQHSGYVLGAISVIKPLVSS
jgi:hypothetical protein